MNPSGVITLTTDYGHKGPFAGVMRGVILSRFPAATVIDLGHDIPPQWPPEAGFWIERSYRYFPPGTVHVAIVDPGVGGQRDILIAERDGHVFIAPDNGLLAPMLEHGKSVRAWRLDFGRLESLQLGEASVTFQGRDIFAPIAAEFAAGRIAPGDVGSATREWTPGWVDEPEAGPGRIRGAIVAIDSFGNLISNIDANLLTGFREPVANIAGHQLKTLQSYSRARPGEFLALINSYGVVEIARSEGNAAEGLGTERGAPLIISEGIA